MKKQKVLLITLFFSSQLIIAQTSSYQQIEAQCNCKEEFSTIKNHIELNYAGFKDKVTVSNIQQYKEFTSHKEQISAQANNKHQCYYVINQWMSYFNDNHLYTGLNAEELEKIQPKKLQTDFPIEKLVVSEALKKN